jgi:hypothetical protein
MSTPLASRPATRSAPLSDAIVAGRTTAAQHGGPVIHVTIDRIDVLAPSSPRPVAEQRRARSQPMVSLSDYLRESGRGGRG